MKHHHVVDSLRQALPEFRLSRIEELGEGDDCHAYLMNGNHAFLFARHATASERLRRVAALTPVLQPSIRIHIPVVEYTGVHAGNGHAFIGYPVIPGVALESATFSALERPVQHRLAGEIASFLLQMHRFPPDAARARGVQDLDLRARCLTDMQRAQEQIFPLVDRRTRDYCTRLLDAYLDDGGNFTQETALLHGDLSPDHILFDPESGRLTGMIDFGDVCIADPDYDLIYLHEDYGPGFMAIFLEHYPHTDTARLLGKVDFFSRWDTLRYILDGLQPSNQDQINEGLTLLQEQADGAC